MIVRYGKALMTTVEETIFTTHFFTSRTSSFNFKLFNIKTRPPILVGAFCHHSRFLKDVYEGGSSKALNCKPKNAVPYSL
jgi:hypothetical protein